jgi:hypothetical protein
MWVLSEICKDKFILNLMTRETFCNFEMTPHKQEIPAVLNVFAVWHLKKDSAGEGRLR